MSATPLPTTGITGGISETGVATIEVPLYVETLAEALTALPNLGVGIPYRSRSFTQEDDGGFKVTLHYEGISNEAPRVLLANDLIVRGTTAPPGGRSMSAA